jgi:hypothetical protein
MRRRQLVLVSQRRAGGRKKSRVRLGPLPFIFFVALVLLAAMLAETLVTRILSPTRIGRFGALPIEMNVERRALR